MFKTSRRTLLAALAVTAVAAPATASARFEVSDPPSGVAPGSAVYQAPTQPASTSQAPTIQPSSGGFEWADAGIGAAATVALMGAGGLALGGRRRRGHVARAS